MEQVTAKKTKRVLTEAHKKAMADGKKRVAAEKAAALAAGITETKTETLHLNQDESESETAEDKATTRPQRVPLAEQRNITNVENIPAGYHARWINDEKDKIAKRLERGYCFAFDDPTGRRIALEVGETRTDANRRVGSIVSKVVQVTSTGPIVAYLMLQRQEWFDEDQDFQQKEIDRAAEGQALRDMDEGLKIMD